MNKNTKKIGPIGEMDYSSFVGLINERNRPSGGIKTVQSVAVNAFISEKKRMLEIGSNTGFASVNMSLLTDCHVVGIDINQLSVDEASRYAKEQGVKDRVQFIKGSATELPFKDEEFDVVWASNVTSFIEDKKQAILEYLRVLRPGGTLVVVPIYYNSEVPQNILEEVSKAIGVQVKKWDKSFWLNLFNDISDRINTNLQLYYEKDFEYLNRADFIPKYVDQIIENNASNFSEEERKQLKERFAYFMNLFNENLKYAGFSIFLFQKRSKRDEIELFLSKSVSNI